MPQNKHRGTFETPKREILDGKYEARHVKKGCLAIMVASRKAIACALILPLLAMAGSSSLRQGYGPASSFTPNDDGIRAGDDSASIQNAVDAAAKSGSGKVVIPAWNVRTGRPGWTLSRAVLLPGDMTVVIDNARLVLADDVYANFFRSANTWTEKGCTTNGTLRNIRIIGQGTAVLDGGKANDLNESTSCKDGRPHVRANCPILFQNVVDFEVRNLTIENHRYWGTCFCFCRRGRISDLHFIARYDRRNQDGINLRDGCRDIAIANISGQTGDDMIALSGIDRPRTDGYNCWVEGLSPDICHVTISNVSGAAVCHPLIALRNHNGTRLYDIAIDNVVDTPFEVPCKGMDMRRYAIMRIGNGIYWSSRKSTLGETSRITVRGVRCSYSVQGVVVNNTLKDALFSDFHCSGPCASAVTTSGPVWGGIGATMENVTIENATVASAAASPAVLDASFLNPGDKLRNVRLRNCSLVKGGERVHYDNELVELDGGERTAVSAHEGVDEFQGEVVLDRSGRIAFEAEFAEGLPGWELRNYGNRLKLGVEELFGERAFSVTLAGKEGDTLFEAAGRRFPVEAGRGFKVSVRARGSFQMEHAAGQKDRGGTAVEFFDRDGRMLASRFRFGFKTSPDEWIDSERHGTVPEGAVAARLVLGADDPNLKAGEQLLVSRAAVALKTLDSQCLPKGSFESVPFQPGADPLFSRSQSIKGESSVKFEFATASDASGVPGEWSAWRDVAGGSTIGLPHDGWLKYRVTLFSDGSSSPHVRMVKVGNACHSRWNFGPVPKPRVEMLTPSPVMELSRPVYFRIAGPVAINHRKTRCLLLTSFTDSKKTIDVTDRLSRHDGAYCLAPDGGGWKKDQVLKFKVVAEDILGNVAEETRVVYFAPEAKGPRITLRGDGFTLVDGRPFFPIGIFSVRKAKQNGNSFDNAFRSLKDAGFNMAHTYMWKREDPDFKEFLDASKRHGIWLLLNPARQELNLPAERDRPNVLAWYLADDTSRHWTPDSLRMRSGFCAAMDGGRHLSAQADSLGNGVKSRYFDFIPCTDVFLPEIYTVCVKGTVGNEVLFVGSQMRTIFRELAAAGSPVKSIWALLQHFSGWGGWERFPTRAEQRAMTYLAIVKGAHGVVWYTYIGSGESPKGMGAANSPETWEDLASVTRELASIQDDLAAPNVPEQPKVEIVDGDKADGFGDTSVSMLLKDCPGERLLLAVNTSLKPVKARITVRELRQAFEVFEKRAVDAVETAVGTGQFAFTDEFEPNGVHVYRMKNW